MLRRATWVLPLFIANQLLAEDKFLTPEQAVQKMQVPEGFRVHLVAGEPTIVKPIAMTTDDRGRLWVIESHSYPHWITDGKTGKDRILIFEEKPDGTYSKKVFLDNGTNLSGLALGFGGVFLTATPNLLFLPIKPGEDKPAGPPEVLLDGWDLKAKHNVFNSPTWGPDGWLYGCNGILSNSKVGKPGTPDAERVAMNCGVWRYHPVTKKFEQFASGTTNPWGIDFDDYGEMFITNCVIKHLFHIVPGGRYERMFGEDIHPNSFALMQSCADHFHWGGGHWTSSRGGKGVHDDPGGGHAHAGALVYLGDQFPAEYRKRVFMCNIHGNRINQDILERKGSGYVAHHGKDFLLANDPWFRGLVLTAAADGGIYVADWHDTGECHNHDKTHPSGRIYKVTYGTPKPTKIDLASATDEELASLQSHKNDWYVRHARRLLQERSQKKAIDNSALLQLQQVLRSQEQVCKRLRALWALHVIGDSTDLRRGTLLLDDPQEEVSAWCFRLGLRINPSFIGRYASLKAHHGFHWSPRVAMALASELPHLDVKHRKVLAKLLLSDAKYAEDPMLRLLIWYGLEPMAAADPAIAVELLEVSKIPVLRRFLARRFAMQDTNEFRPLMQLLSNSTDEEIQRDVLSGMYDALQGNRSVPAPPGWAEVYRRLAKTKDATVREPLMALAVLFDNQQALAELRITATDAKVETRQRRYALQLLIEKRPANLPPLLRGLLTDKVTRDLALRGLAAYSDPQTPELILKHYPSYTDAEKVDAVATLAARAIWASALLDAMDRGVVPRRDLSPFTARQMLNLKDKTLADKLNRVWGSIRQPTQDKTALLNRYKSLATPEALAAGDRSRGRMIFARSCATCHKLFDEGAKIGPDLTGAQRTNPEYILTKVLDPNAVVGREFQVTLVFTKDGRSINGLIQQETDQVLSLQTPTELIRLPKSEIEERKHLPQSLMPEGMLAQMSNEEVRDLLAYLAGPGQVALPKKTTKAGR